MQKNTLQKLSLFFLLAGLFNSVLVHILRKDGDWIANTLSNYAINEYGIIMQIGFIFFALSCLLIGIFLWKDKIFLTKLSSILFFLCTLCIGLAIIFPVASNGLVITASDYVHLVVALILSSLFPLIVMSLGIRSIPSAKFFKIYSYFYFIILLVGIISTTHFVLTNLTTGLLETTTLGFTEKVGGLSMLIWVTIFLLNYKNLLSKKITTKNS
jgi:hypothetical protein